MNLAQTIRTSSRPFVISGPCSAESDEQLDTVVAALKVSGKVHLIRAGIWKPRTNPDSFEGFGEIALPWLVNAGKKHQLPTAIEVANAKHVELALKAGVDALWIGARTTVNPFTVQEIADAIRGTSIPVLVKNPVNPDLQLWLGAFERLERAGIEDLTAIHRGFSVYGHPKYRNAPNWEIPIGFKEIRTSVPMICDPSHIAGIRKGLLEVSQKAMDLNFDGLMLESHPNPSLALSDPDQQVTPVQLVELLDKLILRSPELKGDVASEIEELREQLTAIDDQLFDLLVQRMNKSELVGVLKRSNNITILQHAHWSRLIASRLERSDEYNLSEAFIRQFMDAIHQESIRHQTKVMNLSKPGDDQERKSD